MRTILNLIWLIVAGIELAVAYVVAGLILCLTIVGIPFGLQSIKLAGFALWPFGRAVVKTKSAGFWAGLGNILWLILAGWWLAAIHILTGILLMLTLVGIPMGVANLKMTRLALAPFGRRIVDRLEDVPEDAIKIR